MVTDFLSLRLEKGFFLQYVDFFSNGVVKDFLSESVVKDFLSESMVKDFLSGSVVKDFLGGVVDFLDGFGMDFLNSLVNVFSTDVMSDFVWIRVAVDFFLLGVMSDFLVMGVVI